MTAVATALVPEVRVLLDGISWETYERLLGELEGQPGKRLAYDRGALEIMSPSYEHDWIGRLLGRFIEMLTYELDIPIKSGKTTTFRRQDLEKGLEPDECYWIQRELVVRGKRAIDLGIDPAPDLAIEIEISQSALDKLGIYAALGVGEVWRHDGTKLRVFVLQEDGRYEEAPGSPALPMLALADVDRFIERRAELDEHSVVRAFCAHVRDRGRR